MRLPRQHRIRHNLKAAAAAKITVGDGIIAPIASDGINGKNADRDVGPR
jgi:hypothetical protein